MFRGPAAEAAEADGRFADAVLEPRRERERAKNGAITASLLWNGPSDLDLHAKFLPADGGAPAHIFYRVREALGGKLDVDANASVGKTSTEPVENIYWAKPLPGRYEISVHNYCLRGGDVGGMVPFRAKVAFPDRAADVTGELPAAGTAEVFSFVVTPDGLVQQLESPAAGAAVCAAAPAQPTARAAPPPPRAALATRAAKATRRATRRAARSGPPVKKALKRPAAAPTEAAGPATGKVAKGKYAKEMVFKGLFLKTGGGLKQEDLVKNRKGRIVSKRVQAMGLRMFARNVAPFLDAARKARAELGLPPNARATRGTPLHAKALEIMRAAQAS